MNGAYGEIKTVGINRAILAHFGGGARIWGPIGWACRPRPIGIEIMLPLLCR